MTIQIAAQTREGYASVTCGIAHRPFDDDEGGGDDDVGGGQRLKIEGRGILENVNGAAGLDLVQLTMKFTKDRAGTKARMREDARRKRASERERE